MRRLFYFIFILSFLSCQPDKTTNSTEKNPIQISTEVAINYAKGFTITQYADYKLVIVKNVWVNQSNVYKYVLYKDKKPEGFEDAVFIKTPIQSIACMSLTHIAFIEKLTQENSIVALSGCDNVSSQKIISRIANNLIKEIGQEQSINYEMLVEQSPNIIMGFGIDASSNAYINKMQTLGLKVVLNAEYMENHPLGKAEWIKFIAAFYELDEQANVIFDSIEQSYLDLVELTKDITEKPTVFTGMPWNGTWYVPGAKSYQAQLFKDAGARYLWLDNKERASLVKSEEIILDEAYDADFWLNQDSYNSMAAIVDFDEKFKEFKAVQEQHLFNNNKRINVNSGNDYWETGVVNPQLILKDLIKIFHPELLENKLYYYKKLE